MSPGGLRDQDVEMGRIKHPNRHSIVFRSQKTSVSLEAPFWTALQKIASERRQTISDTVAFISERGGPDWDSST